MKVQKYDKRSPVLRQRGNQHKYMRDHNNGRGRVASNTGQLNKKEIIAPMSSLALSEVIQLCFYSEA